MGLLVKVIILLEAQSRKNCFLQANQVDCVGSVHIFSGTASKSTTDEERIYETFYLAAQQAIFQLVDDG